MTISENGTKTWRLNTSPWLEGIAINNTNNAISDAANSSTLDSTSSAPATNQRTPACRVIIDNDFAGDPDDLFQLTHHILCETVDIRLIIVSHLHNGDFIDPSGNTVAHGMTRVHTLLDLMGVTDYNDVLVAGSERPLPDARTPQPSAARDAIIREAMRNDTKLPLYYVAGGGVTDLMSAYLTEPRIAERMTVIWIGGQEYPGLAEPPLGRPSKEYNAQIDPIAARMLLTDCTFPLWQVPRNAYRQCLVSTAELAAYVRPCGELGAYLCNEIDTIRLHGERYGTRPTGAYCLGDSPLVSLTALLTPWGTAPASHQWVTIARPALDSSDTPTDALPVSEQSAQAGRGIHVVTQVDNRLLFGDLFARLSLFRQWRYDERPRY